MRVLGIDCSSNTIGWCVLDINLSINFVAAGYIKPPKKGDIIERLNDTRNQINKLFAQYQPTYIGIEEIIQFMKGKSTAKTIIMLTTFNRMIGLLAYDYLKSSPQFFNVMSIRHGLKINKILPKKEEMPELVAQHLKMNFNYEINKNKKIKVENYDKADGMAVALYYAFILSGKIKSKKKVKK